MSFPIHSGDIKIKYPDWSDENSLPEEIKPLKIDSAPDISNTQYFVITGAEKVGEDWYATFSIYDIPEEFLEQDIPEIFDNNGN